MRFKLFTLIALSAFALPYAANAQDGDAQMWYDFADGNTSKYKYNSKSKAFKKNPAAPTKEQASVPVARTRPQVLIQQGNFRVPANPSGIAIQLGNTSETYQRPQEFIRESAPTTNPFTFGMPLGAPYAGLPFAGFNNFGYGGYGYARPYAMPFAGYGMPFSATPYAGLPGLGGFGYGGGLMPFGGFFSPGSAALYAGAFGNAGRASHLGEVTPTKFMQSAPSKASGNYYQPSTIDSTASGSYYAAPAGSNVILMPQSNDGPSDYWGPQGNPFPGLNSNTPTP